jgi:transcriptional regulator with XRE-family HTH domain
MTKHITWDDFPSYLRRIRQTKGCTQKWLADQVGCSQIHLWRLEHGMRKPSKMLLHSLGQNLPTCPEDRALLAAFETMVRYHCDSIEVEGS